ncbi:hypothetical protein [Microbacterium flavum]|uniref:NTP pyrophosphohydrolase n=1 Tax=Microbacterium flavum TaxID=415216 RepID=A0ABS5XS80_9MICO|nr:hypothetical protein [Microbacterium flavum]MBT8796836.1 hypothetical protein [Microbacterium flavum]
MVAAGAGHPGVDPQRVPAGAAPAGQSYPGRITVKDRVLVKIAEETTAATLKVDRGDVNVDVAEARGGMAVTIRTPLPVPNLEDTNAIRAGTPVLDRVARVQEQLRDRIGHIAGREVTRVNVTITGAVIAEQKRVR